MPPEARKLEDVLRGEPSDGNIVQDLRIRRVGGRHAASLVGGASGAAFERPPDAGRDPTAVEAPLLGEYALGPDETGVHARRIECDIAGDGSICLGRSRIGPSG